MKITDLKCAIIGTSPIVRIVTDEGIDGFGQGGYTKPFLKPFVEHFRDQLIGADPTDVERTMLRIRQRGTFKPYGTAISIIENALWDIAGKAAGVPVYKLLGGKVRDRVATYNGNLRSPIPENTPEAYAESMRTMKTLPHNFQLVKQGVAFHSQMKYEPGFYFGTPQPKVSHGILDRGLLTMQGMNHLVDCVTAMKDVLGDDVMLALDCGPGMMPTDVVRLSERLEHLNIAWLEDTVTGDYTPYVLADVLRDVTVKSKIPIHTGEQIYLRQHFRELIETQAVNIIGPDPADVGGMAEMKWIAEYADLHGILIAPHGTGNGLLGLACQVQVGATLPANFIAFEYPTGNPDWWYDIVEGLPDPIVVNGEVEVWDRPGMGVNLIPEAAQQYLQEEDQGFFD